MPHKYDLKTFIEKAKIVHGDKYDYSLVEYKSSNEKVKIICFIHGIFEQKPNIHIKGCGCYECGKTNLTKDYFIEKAKIVHNDKYDYSLAEYKNNRTKVKIICPIHGIFEQKANYHLSGNGCQKCGRTKLTTEQFIDKAKKVHGDKYDYSLVEYKDNKTKVKIICPIHGVFEITPKRFLNGYSCPKCINLKDTNGDFIKKAKKVHGDKYDYSLVNYQGFNNLIKIICPIHGEFEQISYYHLAGNGCKKCSKSCVKNNEYFINKAKEVHGDKYDYSLIKYIRIDKKIDIICPIHGVFKQKPKDHLKTCGCPICNSSKGEIKISNFLNNINISYETQKSFKNCKYINILKFDFYLPEYNTCIEFDGRQHFEIIEKWGGEEYLQKQKNRDNIKNIYCKENNIKLFRIKYNDDIKEKLNNILCVIKN